jgi:hypothetical protein
LDDPAVIGVVINVHMLIRATPLTTAQPSGLLSCFGIAKRNSAKVTREGTSYVRSGGHWFSVGKIFTGTAGTENEETIQISESSAGGTNEYQWYNHDSFMENAQLLTNGLESFINDLTKDREVQMWSVRKM